MSLLLVQTYRFSPENVLWTSFADNWRRRGYQMVLWSNLEQGALGLPFLPFVYGDREYQFYRQPTGAVQLPDDVLVKWKKRAKAVEEDYGMSPFNFDAEKMVPLIDSVFRKLKPAGYLAWAGIEPHFGIARDVAESHGIPTAVIEKGLIGPTKLLDFDGVAGMCSLCEIQLEDLVAKNQWDRVAQRAGAFIPSWLGSFTPRSNSHSSPTTTSRLPNCPGKIKVVVIGCYDLCIGISYPDELKAISLPGYIDGFDVALQMARQLDAVVLYKPHPNEPPKPSWSLCPDNLIICNENVVNAVEWADVVVGYGSTVDLLVMAMNKPLVLAGRSFLLNKGVAYEALTPTAIPASVAAAASRCDWAERQRRFEVFIGYLLDEYLFNNEPGGPARQSLDDLVAKVAGRFGLKSSGATPLQSANAAVRTVLSSRGRQEVYWPPSVLRTKHFIFGRAAKVRKILARH